MNDLPPDWAIERANELADTEGVPRYGVHDHPRAFYAFARYIAAHEEPPVDPLLIEARKIVLAADSNPHPNAWSIAVEAGKHDDGYYMAIVMQGLRRGIEIAKERG